MKAILRDSFLPVGIPLAWLQLTSNKGRFAAALAGAAFSAMLMIFQMSAYDALLKGKVLRPIRGIDADLIMVSRNSVNILLCDHFPRTRLAQADNLPEVAEAAPLYLNTATWKNPQTLYLRNVYVFGVDPAHAVFTFPGVREHQALLKQDDALLFDGASPEYYGPVKRAVETRGEIKGEMEGRRVRVCGLFTMGPTLDAECHLIGGTQAFFRLFPGRNPDQVDLGAIRLKPGADPEKALLSLGRLLPDDVALFTKAGFAQREQSFWENRSPIGIAIYAMMVVAMLTGAVVVYQILYTDVNEHLPEYATLKAIGLTDRFLERLILAEALLLQMMSFALGCLFTAVVFLVVSAKADLPLRMGFGTLAAVFLFTAFMCGAAGLMATRRLRSADPADTF